jgi:hypothetical protein
MDLHEILAARAEGALFAQLEEPRYVVMAYALHPNGTTGDAPIEDPEIAARIGEKTGLGTPTDPNGWAIWVVPS